jgi:hypothetical protein
VIEYVTCTHTLVIESPYGKGGYVVVLAFAESCKTALIDRCESKKEGERPYTGARNSRRSVSDQFDSVMQFKVVPRTLARYLVA